jgi:hypothetical protein
LSNEEKRNDLYENLKKGGIVEKRGEEETLGTDKTELMSHQ